MKKLGNFCESYHINNPFPITEFLLCSFAAYLADNRLAPSTIKSYLAAIQNAQLLLGFRTLVSSNHYQSSGGYKQVSAGLASFGDNNPGSGCQSRPNYFAG